MDETAKVPDARRAVRAGLIVRADLVVRAGLVLLLALLTGCFSARTDCYSLPDVPVALELQADAPGTLVVRVVPGRHVRQAGDHEVSADGRVSFVVGRSGLHCVSHTGPFASSSDEPDDAPLLQIRRGEVLLLSLSARQLEQLPLGSDGFRTLRLPR